MGVFFLYASFPNSRLKLRNPTTDSQNYHVTVNNQDVATLINVAPSNPNRTYILIENLSNSVNAIYIYANTSLVNPTTTATSGVFGDLIYNPTTHILYQKQDAGTTTNWTTTTIDLVGTPISPLQTASLDNPQDIYVAGAQTGGATAIAVAIDVGEG